MMSAQAEMVMQHPLSYHCASEETEISVRFEAD